MSVREILNNTGDNGERDTPVLIPNTAVKPLSADGTWLETARESRSLPVTNLRNRLIKAISFFNEGHRLNADRMLPHTRYAFPLVNTPPIFRGIAYEKRGFRSLSLRGIKYNRQTKYSTK